MKNIISLYVNAWNKLTIETIKEALQKCCNNQVTYTDRVVTKLAGIDHLAELIMKTYVQAPQRKFSVLTQPECFDKVCPYSWEMKVPEKGNWSGRDSMEFDEGGSIVRVVGFLPIY